MIAGLSVCSGYGGLDLALEEYVKPIAYVEIEEYCQKIIAYRMAEGSLKRAPILADIKNVEGKFGICDILYGGTPCQNFSVAGDRKGLEGERSSLFFEFARLAREIKPSLIFWENVPGARTKGFTEVARTFAEMGYDCRWTIVSAQAVGANHRRERLFMLAHAIDPRGWQTEVKRIKLKDSTFSWNDGEKEFMADTFDKNVGFAWGQKTKHSEFNVRSEQRTREAKPNHWSVEPDVGRVANGVAFRVDRIKALGNGVVPQQARVAFRYLINQLD